MTLHLVVALLATRKVRFIPYGQEWLSVKDGRIRIVFNTPLGGESFYGDSAIRKSAVLHNVLLVTTLTATVRAIRALRERVTDVASLQEIHFGERRVADGAGGPSPRHGTK